MPRTIVRNVKPAGSAGIDDYTSLAAWVAGEARDLTRMRGFSFLEAAPTTLTKGTTYTFSNGWQGIYRGTDGVATLGRFEEVSGTFPAVGATVSDGTNTYTISSVDYTEGEIALALCFAMTDTTAVDFTGSVYGTSQDCHIVIQAAAGAEARSYWRSTGAYTLANASGVIALNSPPAYTVLHGLQIQAFNYGISSLASITVDQCYLLKGGFAGAGTGLLFRGNAVQRVQSCIISSFAGGIEAYSYISGANQRIIYNCTLSTTSTGIDWGTRASSTLVRNCVIVGASTCYKGDSPPVTADHNASSDATAPGTDSLATIPFPDWVDPANGDFSLRHTDTVLRGKGTDLSAQGVTTDIGGHARVRWDIGADESPNLYRVAVSPADPGGYDRWYTSLQAAANSQTVDYNTLNRITEVTCYPMPDGPTTLAWGSGATSSRHMEIVAAPGAGAGAALRTSGVYEIVGTAAATALAVAADYARVSGVQIRHTGWGRGVYLTGREQTVDRVYSHNSALRNTAPGGGIIISNTDTRTFVRNTIVNGWWTGVTIVAAGTVGEVFLQNVTVGGSGVAGSGAGILLSSGKVHLQNVVSAYSHNADYSGNGYSVQSDSAAFYSSDGSASTGKLAEQIILTSDPFVDWPNGDFSLKPGAELIDAGADLSSVGVTTDIAGTARPQGTGWDIGAFEYSAGAPSPAALGVPFSASAGLDFAPGIVPGAPPVAIAVPFASPEGADPAPAVSVTPAALGIPFSPTDGADLAPSIQEGVAAGTLAVPFSAAAGADYAPGVVPGEQLAVPFAPATGVDYPPALAVPEGLAVPFAPSEGADPVPTVRATVVAITVPLAGAEGADFLPAVQRGVVAILIPYSPSEGMAFAPGILASNGPVLPAYLVGTLTLRPALAASLSLTPAFTGILSLEP